MTEHDLQNLIRLRLSELGFTVFRANVGKVRLADGRFFETGLPRGFSDIFAVKDGRVYFIECKAPGGRVREEQKNFILQMRRAGCKAGIAYSVADAERIVDDDGI